jgi:hypothetical protein
LLDDNEQIPAKIWELLRRNRDFRDVVETLTKLDAKERSDSEKSGKYHGTAWQKSCRLVKRAAERHPFAGFALQWLVPEPLFHCLVAPRPHGKKWKQRGVFIPRFSRVGEGVTPNVKDKGWVWRNPNKRDTAGHLLRRGPEVYWTKSRFKRLRSRVNPILEWKRYVWPFTVEHSWADAPAEFRREFQFIWRRQFDCRPTNPITKDRRDSPSPHETDFFQGWNLADFGASGRGANLKELAVVFRFNDLAYNYRVFAIPKTILTKASADAMGKWLAGELKKDSRLYADLLRDKLLNEAELFGTANEWTDWLAYQAGHIAGVVKDTHFYRRCRYMNSLVDLVYPKFEVGKLLAPPIHRARGKKYVGK